MCIIFMCTPYLLTYVCKSFGTFVCVGNPTVLCHPVHFYRCFCYTLYTVGDFTFWISLSLSQKFVLSES